MREISKSRECVSISESTSFTFHESNMKVTPLTGVCLVVAVGLTQDLKLILSTKKHQTKQNKENKTQARIHLLQKKVEKDSLWRICAVCYSNNILEITMPWWRYAVSYRQPHCEEAIAVYFLVHLLCTFYRMPPVPSPESGGLYEWDMLPIKIYFKIYIYIYISWK